MNSLPLFTGPKPIETTFRKDAEVVIYTGDVRDFLAQIPDECITLVVTSPPYNLGKEYEDRASIESYLRSQEQVIADLKRILRPDGNLCWQVGNFVENGEVYPLDILYYPIFKRLGFKLRNRIIWRFGHGLHASKRFSGRYETLLWFTKSEKYVFNLDAVRIPVKYPGKRHYKGPNRGKPSSNPLGKNPSDVWDIVVQDWENLVWDIPNVKSNHPEKTIHPCQFPIELVERCVLALSNPSDWVLDPYMGVGSTLLAALMHDRKGAGSEKEPKYVDIAYQRLRALFEGNLRYRPLGRPIYQPSGREKISRVPEEWLDK
jgi:adenine-specific DNA-methyltransferase